MKIKNRIPIPACALLAVSVISGPSCSTDWGKVDPPAGVQTAPRLENVATFEFEDEMLDQLLMRLYANEGGQLPALAEDTPKGKVLDLNNGYVELNNPFNNVTCEKAASMTFWVKQIRPVSTDEEGNEVFGEQDVASPIFSFLNENKTQSLTISPNFGINYNGADGTWTENDPAEYKTGFITPDQWNFVALIIRNDGYDLFVDGKKKVSKDVTDFDCSKLVSFINNVNTFTIGSPENASHWVLDDLKLYRNQITAKEIARPTLPGEGGGQGGFDFATFEYLTDSPKYTVGADDCSTGWWTEFSNYFRIPAETSLRISFINHTSGGGNWNNWNLCLATDADRGADGYAEYFVIRSDLYGWGDSYNGDNWTSTGYGDWDKFRLDMEGAAVTLDITRQGDQVKVKAVATAKDGTVYNENITATCGDGTQVVRAFLICDGSYFEMDNGGTFAYWPAQVDTPSVGAPDCSAGWWTDFSDYFTIPANLSLHLNFVNATNGAGNWNNWNLCLATDAERGGDGYEEYFVVRSDLYGWGASYDGANWTSEGYGDWDKFRLDMAGADVTVTVVRENEKATYKSVAKAADGTVYTESIWGNCGDGSQTVRAFLICDGSHFDMNADECFTFKTVL